MHCVYLIFQKNLQLIIWKKKTGLKGVVELFSVDFNNILDIHKYLMKRT